MRRYPAYDPPEYVDWSPDPDELKAFRARVAASRERSDLIQTLDGDAHLALYRDLLRTRLHDIGLKRWVRTGVISKAWLGTGEEAVTVGAVSALDRSGDIVCPMIRNAGALHMMGMPLPDLFRGYLATPDSPSRGRDLHIGDLGTGILQPISHMGINVPVVAGLALAFRLRREPRVALTWVGDGATRCAAFHEGMNLAAVQGVPAVFVIQNNQVALGTRISTHGSEELERWGPAYGIPVWKADGNHVLDMWAASSLAVEAARSGEGPAIVVADTFRMGGHATHDEREARETFPSDLFRSWGRRDPIGLFEAYLLEEGIPAERLVGIEQEVTEEMERAATVALESRSIVASPDAARFDGFSTGTTRESIANRPFSTI